jgi:shikimate kinase
MINSIVLFGFKGVGKTHLGKLLSQDLQLPFVDTDDLIEKKYKISVRNLYYFLGEEKFREIEKQIIREISLLKSHVIALGAGAILDRENQRILESSHLIYLKASFATVQKRIFKEGIPAYLSKSKPVTSLKKIYLERIPIYESISAKCVDVDLLNELDCVRKMRESWHQTLLAISFE